MDRMRWWLKLWNGDDDDLVMDHVPISGKLDHRKKVAKARERHGKQFHSHTTVARTEPPSRTLLEIQAFGKGEIEVVRQIKRRAQ